MSAVDVELLIGEIGVPGAGAEHWAPAATVGGVEPINGLFTGPQCVVRTGARHLLICRQDCGDQVAPRLGCRDHRTITAKVGIPRLPSALATAAFASVLAVMKRGEAGRIAGQ